MTTSNARKKFAPRPDVAKVGVHLYQIHWLTEDEWAEHNLKTNADGITYSHKQCIYMRLLAESSESHFQVVLLHELLHAAWDACQMTHIDWDDIKGDIEENIVSMQSPALLGVLKDNPHIVEYLVSNGDNAR